MFCQFLIIDDQLGLSCQEPSPDLLILELLLPEESVSVDEVVFPIEGGLGIAAAPGEGGLSVWDPSLLELTKVLGDIMVDVETEQGSTNEDLYPHADVAVSVTVTTLWLSVFTMEAVITSVPGPALCTEAV